MNTDIFEHERPRLRRIAYRMLGSVAEAEDVVQNAWLRWSSADRPGVREPAAWLTRTVTRLALDVLKSARARRETYTGTWLPEPLVDDAAAGFGDDALGTALMVALERLSPLERAAFILHDVFGVELNEVATTLAREPAAVRQLASRARAHVRESRPRFDVNDGKLEELTRAFHQASRTGDVAGLQGLLSAQAVMHGDGGGKRMAIINTLVGRDSIVKFFHGVAPKVDFSKVELVRFAMIDGLPSLITREPDGILQTTSLQFGNDGIEAIFVVRNPDKLRHLEH